MLALSCADNPFKATEVSENEHSILVKKGFKVKK